MHRISRFVVCVGILSLANATYVAAEPISVTSGFLLVTGPFEPGSVSIAGTRGFSLDAVVTPGEGRVDAVHLECSPLCLPSSTISVGAFLGGAAFRGTAMLDGNSYDLSGGVNDPAGVALEFTGRAMLPALEDAAFVTTPFNAMGWFSLPSGEQSLMSGAGVVSLWLAQTNYPDLPRGWVVDRVRYDFREDLDPVPEPATLSLLGIGLAATALRLRTHRKEHGDLAALDVG